MSKLDPVNIEAINCSVAPITKKADFPIADNLRPITADTDNRSDLH